MMCRLAKVLSASLIVLFLHETRARPLATIGGIFEAAYHGYVQNFSTALADINSRRGTVRFNEFLVVLNSSVNDDIAYLCQKLPETNVNVVLGVGDVYTMKALVTVTSMMGIPVLGYITDNRDNNVKVRITCD